jgi:hypothetical protein
VGHDAVCQLDAEREVDLEPGAALAEPMLGVAEGEEKRHARRERELRIGRA